MKTLTHDQRMEGFTELEGVLGEGGVGGAHLMSFLAGIAHAEKVLGEEQDDEPVDISDKSEPTVAAILPNGVRVTNVYEAYEAGLKAGTEPDDETWEKGFRQGIQFAKARYGVCTMPPNPKQDDEPVAWLIPGGITERKDLAEANGSNAQPLYLHPAPRKPFVRLTDKELENLGGKYVGPMSDGEFHLMVITQNALEEKNK